MSKQNHYQQADSPQRPSTDAEVVRGRPQSGPRRQLGPSGGSHGYRRKVARSRVRAETCRSRRRQSGHTEGQTISETCRPRDSYGVNRPAAGGEGLRRRRGGQTKRGQRARCDRKAGVGHQRPAARRGDGDGASGCPGGNCRRNRPRGALREGSRHSIKRNGRGPGEVRAGNCHIRSNWTERRRKRAEADAFEESYDVVGRGGPNRGNVDWTGKRSPWRAVEGRRIIERDHIL